MLLNGIGLRILESKTPLWVQAATIMKLQKPPNYDHVILPERRRLKVMEKIPQPISALKPNPKMTKLLVEMRGPEKIHNKIIYGEYAIQAMEGGRIKPGHIEAVRMQVLRKINEKKSFAYWRIDAPWQPLTKHALGTKLGGGKGKITKYVVPVKSGRIIFEIGGKVVQSEVDPYLTRITKLLPFKSRVVSRKMLEEEEENEKLKRDTNMNVLSFKYCAQKNMLGCDTFLSPYDRVWFGKYR